MSLLCFKNLCKLISLGIIRNSDYENVNSSSIDLTLGRKILVEDISELRTIDLRDRTPLTMTEWDLVDDGPFILMPNQFILAGTLEKFYLPNNISGKYMLKSSMARIGLEHLQAGWADAGWNDSVLTLELKNLTQSHAIRLHYGDHIGQMIFFEHEEVPDDKSYAARGRYNGDSSVMGAKKK